MGECNVPPKPTLLPWGIRSDWLRSLAAFAVANGFINELWFANRFVPVIHTSRALTSTSQSFVRVMFEQSFVSESNEEI